MNDPDIRYPYKNKNWFCVHWKKQAIKIEGRYIYLSNGKGRQGIVFKLPVSLLDCQPNTVELIWRNGYWLSITLEVEGKMERAGFASGEAKRLHQQVLGFSTAAIDMGEIGHKHKPNGRNYNCQNPECNLKIHREVVGASNIRIKHLTGELNGSDNFQSPKVKYLRIDDLWSLKSSSVDGVNRRERRKPRSHRRRFR